MAEVEYIGPRQVVTNKFGTFSKGNKVQVSDEIAALLSKDEGEFKIYQPVAPKKPEE